MASLGKSTKLCFVTIGATATFKTLIEAVLDIEFAQTLRELGYTELRVQYGSDGKAIFESFVQKHSQNEFTMAIPPESKVAITGFGFKEQGLASDMRDAKGGFDDSIEGLVISHGGTGSILDAFRVNVPLVVVPNATLLDNHQQELANELARQKYVVVGNTDNLAAAVNEIERQRQIRKPWQPVNQQDGLTGPQRFARILNETMGFVD